jgi:hypothetical protein
MDNERIGLSFDESDKYRMEFFPAGFWGPFSSSYDALPWEQQGESLFITAENYSYLLDILVHARRFYLNAKHGLRVDESLFGPSCVR